MPGSFPQNVQSQAEMPRKQRDVYSKIIGESAVSEQDEKQAPQSGTTVVPQEQRTVAPLQGEEVRMQEGKKGTMQRTSNALPYSSNEGITQESSTTSTQESTEATTQKGKKAKTHKITFYPGPRQEHKLNELIVEYWYRHSIMINQNDILRHLVEQCSIDSLDNLSLEE
jgi:hypothetical protein